MKLVPTHRTDYGLRALIHLARQGRRVKAVEIASAMGIPPTFLYQILQDLQRARLVTSQPGRSGGYALAIPAEEVTILQIVEALEGPVTEGECALRGGPCYWEDVCPLHRVWSGARQALADQLASATLAHVAEEDRALAEGTLPVPPDSHRRPRRAAGTSASRDRS